MSNPESLPEYYTHVISEKSDPRSIDWPLVSSPIPTIVIVGIYLLFVKYGRVWMDKRQPFSLTKFMIVYNTLLVAWSTYMFKELLVTSLLNPEFNVVCSPVDYSADPMATRMVWVQYMFYISKLVELLDTVIFILRKKYGQVTFLHVYHHALMPLLWYCSARWVGGGESFCAPLLNSFVHIWMYSYYALSALGPSVQRYLWWKKYLTLLQLSQFAIVISKTVLALCVNCGFPPVYLWAQGFYMTSLLLLFINFYSKAYSDGNPRAARTTRKDQPKLAAVAKATVSGDAIDTSAGEPELRRRPVVSEAEDCLGTSAAVAAGAALIGVSD